ncbi:hypothetical protein BDP27DRAFT_608200 [Rhodocollybia butyracea]|uniref:Uncharacterized protein n=1 Tax=Rhodocollybia butyracea TaxID=206335 RepID=A0A9P5UEL3_9AGAR|nr:hypothetical protein BDP27DRAFT_608200 [Rhodocollybia butyracea]
MVPPWPKNVVGSDIIIRSHSYLSHEYSARTKKNPAISRETCKKIDYVEAVSKLEQPCFYRLFRDWSFESKLYALIVASGKYGVSLANDGIPILVQTPCDPCSSKLHTVNPQECGCRIETKVVYSPEDATPTKAHFKLTEMETPRLGINAKGPLYHACRDGCLMPPEWLLETTLDNMRHMYKEEPFVAELLAQRGKYGWRGIQETPETPTMIYEPVVRQNPNWCLSKHYGDVSAVLA